MLSFECIKNEKSVYFLLTSADSREKAVKAGTEQKNWVERMKESLYVQTTPRWWSEN